MFLNVPLLVVCVCIVLVLTFYLFYWNRLLAFVFSLVLRLALWNQGEASVWVEFGSFHFSTLAGRILIKDLRYHSSSQTFRIVKVQISWRYWIRGPAEEEDLSHARILGESGKQSAPLKCRIHITLQGLEWLMYNRTAAFDNVMSCMETDMPTTPAPGSTASVRKVFSRTSIFRDSSILGPPLSLVSSIYKRTPKAIKRGMHWLQRQMPNLDPKDLLPISLEVLKGAITIGNASTPNLLVAEFQRAEGTYGIVEARSKHDQYKQVLNVRLQNPAVSYVANDRYTSPAADVGRAAHEHMHHAGEGAPLRRGSYLSFYSFQRMWLQLKLWRALSAAFTPSAKATQQGSTWTRGRGKKHRDEEMPPGVDFTTLEYAIERKILEASVVELLYYADVVGVVPSPEPGQPENSGESLDMFDIGNGDLPPEWGIDLVIRGGFIRYGPWADRQRVLLQHAFFPPMYANSRPTPRLKPGDMRMWTGMKIFIELRDGVTLQLPFREASKNWQWDDRAPARDKRKKREAAFIHLRAGDSSTISYIVPMIASAKGYLSMLEVHLDTVTVTSSLNDIRLLTAETCRIRSHLPAPLKWNGLRQWTFAISLRQPCFYLLRDHINMFTDLGKDWASGPPSDYNTFTPMIYVIDFDMHNYAINLYVNDHNIIDKPLIKDENALLTLRGTRFTLGAHMPFTKYRPEASTVSFWLEVPDVFVGLSLPRWNISSLYPTPDRSQVGRIGMLNMNGSYRYFAEVKPDNIDELKLQFTGKDVIYKAFGWTIRYFMILRDNYFGSFTHFSTLTEYLRGRHKGEPLGDPIHLQYREGKANGMQVTLGLEVDNGLIVVPAGFPGYEKYAAEYAHASPEDLGPSLLLTLPALQLHLRTNDYYMEMSVNIDTITGRIQEHCYNASIFTTSNTFGNKREKIVIDGLDVTANRLFGHRPATSTYVCIWEIHVGDVKTALNAYEARLLSVAGSSFGLNFSDPLNAPAKEYVIPTDPDVTFLKVKIDSVNAVWSVDGAAVEFSLPHGLRIDSNDLAGKSFRKVTGIRLPEGTVKLLLASKLDRSRWLEAGDARFDVDLDIYSAPLGWHESARLQTEFIAKQDAETGRAKVLYTPEDALSATHRLRPGRGILDNDFYLPQIRIPKLYPMISVPDERAGPLTSLQEDLSESDLDPLPEAERDARVADLRPLSFVTDAPSDNELSGGDESDDGDTDWSTDYADTLDDASIESPWPSARQYSTLCRHYTSRHIKRPVSWSSTPFSLTKDVFREANLVLYAVDDNVNQESLLSAIWAETDSHDGQDLDKTTFHVRSKDGVVIWITPMVLPIVTQLLADISSGQLSPELRFDSLTISYIKSFKLGASSQSTMTLFDVRIPTLEVRSVQIAALGPQPDVPSETRFSEVVTVAEFHSSALHLRGRLLKESNSIPENNIACAFAGMSLALSSRPLGRGYFRQNPTRICHLTVGPTFASMLQRNITASLGVVSSDITHTGPNFILATIVVLVKYVRGPLIVRKHPIAGLPPLSDRQAIHCVLVYSRDRSVVDPLSTIQPSYLVQNGLPDHLRKDTTFKFLVYLRNCLRSLDEHEREALHVPQPDVLMDDVLDTLQAQWFGLSGDDDSTNLSQQTFLQKLLRQPEIGEGSPSRTWDTLYDSVSLTIGGTHLSLRHPAELLESNLVCGPMTFEVHRQQADFVQPMAWNPGKSFPNITSRDKERHNLLRLAVCVTLDRIFSTVHPDAVEFMQIVLRDYRHHYAHLAAVPKTRQPNVIEPSASPTSIPHPSPQKAFPTFSLDCTLLLRSFSFTSAAQQLIARIKSTDVTYSSSSLASPPSPEHPMWELSSNQSLNLNSLVFEGCSAATIAYAREPAPKERTLASLSFTNAKTNVVLQQDPHNNLTFRVTSGLGAIHLDIPRSALRLYRFLEGWAADYLPGLNSTVRALLSELSSDSKSSSPIESSAKAPPRLLSLQVQLSITSTRATLQVMHGTWVSWEVRDTIGFVLNENRRKGAHVFGLQMGPHAFEISRSRAGSQSNHSARIYLQLPTITLRGRQDTSGLQGMVLVEFFHVTVRPSDWDTLLSVQQKSGQDFTDFIHIIEQSRQRRASPSTASLPKEKEKKPPLKVNGSIKMKGFRIGLEGLTSTLFLECDDISGGMDNHSRSLWHAKLSDLALSLASQTSIGMRSHRDRRSAFVRVDMEVGMSKKTSSPVSHLHVSVTKIHAVMQPSSIGELGDFVDHLQAEILTRREQRATDLEEFKEKTRSLMKSLDVKIGDQKPSQKSLLEMYTTSINIQNIGVAFPLTLARDLQMSRSGSNDESAVRAFLFSIKSLKFGTQLDENGQASMSGFSFQFVSRFRQSNPADFSGETHKTRNRLVYPEVTAHIRSERAGDNRRVCIGAGVSGFILDIDSTIPDFISSLLDVYRRGKDRVERLASAAAPRTSPNAESLPTASVVSTIQPVTAEEQYGALPTSNILLSLTFESGKVRMHSRESSSQQPRSRPLSTLIYGRLEDANGAEEFNLPEVSVWGEFRATPALHKLSSGQAAEPSSLVFKSTIHSSQNTLRPSVLPFVTELMNKVEDHMRSPQSRPPASPTPKPHSLLPLIATTPISPAPVDDTSARMTDPVSSMKISFSLRIDQSKLLFTCRPDANVIAGLHWDSGGFIVNIAPGARRVSFTGTVGGLTISLKHGFLSEDCIKLDARNLNFTIGFAKLQPVDGRTLSSVSAVLDTEFAGSLRFSRFQDVLCFKAVWLDRIPALSGGTSVTPTVSMSSNTLPVPMAAIPAASSTKQELTTAVLIRLRRVELDVDLGQSISNVRLTLESTTVRTKITEDLSELSLAIGNFLVVASGNLAGHAEMPDFQFQTVHRKNHRHAREAGGRMLDLSMTSGVFVVKLDSEYHELIQYRAEPISIYIYDDWSRISSDVPVKDRQVTLDFLVTGSDVLAIMTVGTVPKLVSYFNKFRTNLEAQKEGASRESTAFRMANTPKPDNPLSAVANAMFKSARSRLKEHEGGLSYAIGQRMSLQLKLLRLIVFPRSMRDSELAQFVGEDVHARLYRLIQTVNEPADRDLRLYFSGITISKFTHLHHGLAPKEGPPDSRDWLSTIMATSPEAIIFGLPSMDMQMHSEETVEDIPEAETRRTLSYDFSSNFSKDGVKNADEIYISLNMSLYAWLTVLRKTFAREMEQVQLSSDARLVGPAGTVQSVLSPRKKFDGTTSTTSPSSPEKPSSPEPTVRTRPRARGSISARPVPLAVHSVDDISQAISHPHTLPKSPTIPSNAKIMPPLATTTTSIESPGPTSAPLSAPPKGKTPTGLIYTPRVRKIERLTMRQLGEATPDVMHPFFMKKAGFNLEDSLPQYVHEYATMPTEEIMKALLKLYTKQLTSAVQSPTVSD